MEIETWPIDKVIPYDTNPRVCPEKAVAKVAESLRTYGWRQPIVVDTEGVIIAGHTRRKAAELLGLKTVPVHVAHDMDPDDVRAYRIADNRVAEETSWDKDLLAFEVAALNDADFDLSGLGFEDDEVARLLSASLSAETSSAEVERADEEAPEPPEVPCSVVGDVWVLGEHRLMCGDSTSTDAVTRLLDGAKPHLMVTDPPYGIEYDADWRNNRLRADGTPTGGRAVGKVLNDDRADWTDTYNLFPGDVAYTWHPAGALSVEFYRTLEAAGFEVRTQIIWAKSHFPIGRGDYHGKHEPCWYAVRKGKTSHWNGSRKEHTVWEIAKPQKSETGHSTQKPIECMKRPIENNSVIGDAVYEPFSGSGTTIIAAEMTKRRCYAMELNPAYVDVAVRRWQTFSGAEAMHAETGQSFAEMAAERAGK